MKIKVCGIKPDANMKDVANSGVNMMGFIFHSLSPRFCGNQFGPFTLGSIPENVCPVAVTVNWSEAAILDLASRYGFKYFQLHGEESPQMCDALRRQGLKIIKSIGIKERKDIRKADRYAGNVDYLLFDTKSVNHGGTGKKFNWEFLNDYNLSEHFFLSGGIDSDDVEIIRSLSHPCLEGIDINSGFEITPGVKDVDKLKDFIFRIKHSSLEDTPIDIKKNRLKELLKNKRDNLLAVYFTVGFPNRDSTVEIIDALCFQNVDIIEVGIPFSDPMADGVVIQHSGNIALNNGMTLSLLLKQVKEARKRNPDTPFVAMGYLNPIMQMGKENFFRRAKESGIDGVIIPDLPFDIYMKEYKELSDRYNIPVIMLITPATSDHRIRLIDRHCDGFIYMVSTASTTGARDKFDYNALSYFERINSMNLHHPRLIGFGVSNQSTYDDACRYSNGAIIGSQFIKLLESEPTPQKAAEALMKKIHRK
ncbi:MAG: tryptophan synthase subunit alpha [Muribaculaceae bacterium]|nr:tryptophan synthase subunit alpha [Muribaculaceae bacterium]